MNMKKFVYENFVCKLGETAKENWELLEKAENHYLFFHLSSFPSGYVILEYKDSEPTPFMIQTAAQLCKNGTKYRTLTNIKVDWCRCDNLEKTDKVGEIIFKSNRKVKQITI
jgi:predicted ribosome quality control (RQC) complex YloA/Tae2 family protein